MTGTFDGNTFFRWVVDYIADQDQPIGGNPPAWDHPRIHQGTISGRATSNEPQSTAVMCKIHRTTN